MTNADTPIRIEPETRAVRIRRDGIELASSRHALRLEEGHLSPVWYLPVDALTADHLVLSATRTCCPHKGQAIWYSMVGGPEDVAWCYRTPPPALAAIGHRIAFDANQVTIELDGAPALRTFTETSARPLSGATT